MGKLSGKRALGDWGGLADVGSVHALHRVRLLVGPKLSCNRLERRLSSKLSLIDECQVVAE